MKKAITIGMRFYDERNGCILTTNGVGCDPKVWSCDVEELGDNGEFELVDTCALFRESELRKFKEV